MTKKQQIKDKHLSYVIKNDRELEICGIITEKSIKTLEIPENIKIDSKNSYTVTSIGSKAFENCKLVSSIIIPSSIVTINDHAFSNCSKLKSIIINEGLKHIKEFAFEWCNNIKEIILPNSLEIIEDKAFASCKKLESVSLYYKTKTISDNAFENSDNIIFDIRSPKKNVNIIKPKRKKRNI